MRADGIDSGFVLLFVTGAGDARRNRIDREVRITRVQGRWCGARVIAPMSAFVTFFFN